MVEKTNLSLSEEGLRLLHWPGLPLHPFQRVGVRVRLHILERNMVDKGVFLRQSEWVVEEGSQVLDDLPLVFLHVLEPDKLHIFSVPAFPTSDDMLPVVPIKLQIFKY